LGKLTKQKFSIQKRPICDSNWNQIFENIGIFAIYLSVFQQQKNIPKIQIYLE
jgi:hypothetical protein